MGRGEADPAAVLQLRASLAQILDYYEKVLATRQYLAGNVSI